MMEAMCRWLYKALMIGTFSLIALLAIPMLLCLCLISLIWCAADPLLIRLERRSRKKLTA